MLEFTASSTDWVANTTMPFSFRSVFSQSLILAAKTRLSTSAQASSSTIMVGVPSSEIWMRWNR